jgi:hypothetical protein
MKRLYEGIDGDDSGRDVNDRQRSPFSHSRSLIFRERRSSEESIRTPCMGLRRLDQCPSGA